MPDKIRNCYTCELNNGSRLCSKDTSMNVNCTRDPKRPKWPVIGRDAREEGCPFYKPCNGMAVSKEYELAKALAEALREEWKAEQELHKRDKETRHTASTRELFNLLMGLQDKVIEAREKKTVAFNAYYDYIEKLEEQKHA